MACGTDRIAECGCWAKNTKRLAQLAITLLIVAERARYQRSLCGILSPVKANPASRLHCGAHTRPDPEHRLS